MDETKAIPGCAKSAKSAIGEIRRGSTRPNALSAQWSSGSLVLPPYWILQMYHI